MDDTLQNSLRLCPTAAAAVAAPTLSLANASTREPTKPARAVCRRRRRGRGGGNGGGVRVGRERKGESTEAIPALRSVMKVKVE